MKRCAVFSLAMFVALSLLTSCGGSGGGADGDEGDGTTPAVAAPEIATQIALDFGVALLGRYSEREIVVNNVGTATLDIGQLSLGNPNSGFSVEADNCSNKGIPVSEACTLIIRFTPADQISYSNSLSIPSNEASKNPWVVNLSGKGRALNVSINQVLTEDCAQQVLKLMVSVTDINDDPVLLLDVPNFTVLENGIHKDINPPIRNTAARPLSVTLVLDYSGSLSDADRIGMEDSAKIFIASLQFPAEGGNDEAAIVKFALTIGAKTPFTSVENDLNAAIDAPYPGDINGTILYEATIDAIAQYVGRPAGSKQALIVFSDGNDEESTSTLTDVINSAIHNDIPVFTIAYISSSISKPEIMQQLAQETGGQFFLAPTTQLAGIYQTISTILSNQYLIEYTTSSSSGDTVSVVVEVDEVGNLGEASKDAAGCP